MKKLYFSKKNTGSNELSKIIFLSLIFYIILIFFAIGIGLTLTKLYGTEPKDVPSVISNMFVWSATLISPLVVILLINSWKSQKDYELKKEYASNILKDTHSIELYLIDTIALIKTMQDINKYLVVYKKYFHYQPMDVWEDLQKSYANIKIFNELYDKSFGEKFSKLQIYSHAIDENIKDLISAYSVYFESLVKELPDLLKNENHNFKKLFPYEDFPIKLTNEIGPVNICLSEPLEIEIQDKNTGEFNCYAKFTSLSNLVDETKILLKDLQNSCINSLRV